MAAGVAAVWFATYRGGGSQSVFPHLFYIPIVFGAIRFGAPGAVGAAVLAGVASGPFLPADTLTGEPQPVGGWVLRMLMFLAIGLVVAWMTRHTPESPRAVLTERRSTARIRTALDRGEVVVHYQPILSLVTGEVVGVEALARWQHPERGLLSPASFVPAAERSGVIVDIDRRVLVQTSAQLARWNAEGRDLWASVNVSATRFAQSGLVEEVERVVRESGLRPERLHLEITETAIIRDVPAAAEQISALRRMGVKVVVDDFGAGQTSLSYLHQFGIDVVKIDRSFVSKTVTDAKAARLVGGVVRLFSSIGTTVVGEGISNAEEYVAMQSLGCELGQGYFLGVPMPPEDVPAYLEHADRRRSRRGR